VPAAELLEQIYASGKVEAEDGTPVDALPRGVPREHALEIRRVVRDLELKRTLEVGMAYGLSTLAICAEHEARGEGSHIAIDPLQSTRQMSIGVLNVGRAGVDDRVQVIEERSDVALPRLRADGLRLDFAFIDGRHVFDAVLVDFFYADLMLETGGVVALHDTWLPSIKQVLRYVRRNRAYELIGGDRAMAVLQKRDDDRRHWSDHRDFGQVSPFERLRRMRRRLLDPIQRE
jgi:predicted O-methyltransferase YrrM